jgi:hypothetical protein
MAVCTARNAICIAAACFAIACARPALDSIHRCEGGTQEHVTTVGEATTRECLDADGRPHGALWLDDPNGLSMRARFEHGGIEGTARTFYQGHLYTENEYRHGHERRALVWDEDGRLRSEFTSLEPIDETPAEGDQEMSGRWHWTRWWPNGGRQEVDLQDGVLDGAYQSWHENGRVKALGTYDRGNKVGVATLARRRNTGRGADSRSAGFPGASLRVATAAA